MARGMSCVTITILAEPTIKNHHLLYRFGCSAGSFFIFVFRGFLSVRKVSVSQYLFVTVKPNVHIN
jgi:hypothetical protein